MIDYKEIYQKLYDGGGYGRGSSCREILYYPLYKQWLRGTVFVVGCGSGDGIDYLTKEGWTAGGIDWVTCHPKAAVGDITQPMTPGHWETALCLDVLEHIERDRVEFVLENLGRYRRQVLSINNKPSCHRPQGHELHITQLPVEEWRDLISQFMEIRAIEAREPGHQELYLCQKHR